MDRFNHYKMLCTEKLLTIYFINFTNKKNLFKYIFLLFTYKKYSNKKKNWKK